MGRKKGEQGRETQNQKKLMTCSVSSWFESVAPDFSAHFGLEGFAGQPSLPAMVGTGDGQELRVQTTVPQEGILGFGTRGFDSTGQTAGPTEPPVWAVESPTGSSLDAAPAGGHPSDPPVEKLRKLLKRKCGKARDGRGTDLKSPPNRRVHPSCWANFKFALCAPQRRYS